jgi:hypothetical protein
VDARTTGKAQHCKRRYKQYCFRIRRESQLAAAVETFLTDGNTSLNFLITRALCAYLQCPLPHRQYDTYERKRIYPPKEVADV